MPVQDRSMVKRTPDSKHKRFIDQRVQSTYDLSILMLFVHIVSTENL
jgi:hypothetical protein